MDMSGQVIDHCAQCGKAHDMTGLPQGYGRLLCIGRCEELYDAAHPEELVGLIRIEDLTRAQRAELDSILGNVAGSA